LIAVNVLTVGATAFRRRTHIASQPFAGLIGLVLGVRGVFAEAAAIPSVRWVVDAVMGQDPDADAAFTAEVHEVNPLTSAAGTAARLPYREEISVEGVVLKI